MVYRDNKKGLVGNFSMEENTKVKQWVLISESAPELTDTAKDGFQQTTAECNNS